MEYPDSVVEQLSSLKGEPWSGNVFRWTFAGIPPERHNTRGARWNPPGVAALYTGMSRDVVKSESDYLIAAQGIAPTRPREMHTLSVSFTKVLRLPRDRLKRLGIDEDALGSINHTECQLVGGAVERLQYEGLIIPSARGPADNLVIFPNRLPYGDSFFKVAATEKL